MAVSNDQIRQTIDRYIKFMNAADSDSIAELYSIDATLEDPVGTEPRQGRETIRKFYAGAVGNVKLELTGKPRVSAGQVAFPLKAKIGGTQNLKIIDVMVFNDDGLITSMRAFFSSDEFEPPA